MLLCLKKEYGKFLLFIPITRDSVNKSWNFYTHLEDPSYNIYFYGTKWGSFKTTSIGYPECNSWGRSGNPSLHPKIVSKQNRRSLELRNGFNQNSVR